MYKTWDEMSLVEKFRLARSMRVPSDPWVDNFKPRVWKWRWETAELTRWFELQYDEYYERGMK